MSIMNADDLTVSRVSADALVAASVSSDTLVASAPSCVPSGALSGADVLAFPRVPTDALVAPPVSSGTLVASALLPTQVSCVPSGVPSASLFKFHYKSQDKDISFELPI